jgi:hypothetical protein
LKERVKGQDEDWMFPNRIRKGKTMKPGPIWHETLLARRIQPVADGSAFLISPGVSSGIGERPRW